VVFTTDRGDMVGNHRMWIKGWIPYEETYRVPLIVRWRGNTRPGSKTDRLVQTHDLAHTYMEAASAAPLPFRGGRALQPLFDDSAARLRPDQILCAYYGGEFLYTQRVGVTQRFKYVFNGFDVDEMYNLMRDPEELHNAVADAEYAKYIDDMRACR
jgi:arylsulfatase A-like enzyme